MPASQEQKVDFLLKKIGYSASKTGIAEDESTISSGSNTAKKPFEEGIPSPLIIPQSSLWADSGYIPTTPPGSDTAYVKGYRTATALRMTRDATVGTNTRSYIAYTTYNNTSSARLTNWIDTQFGSSYIVKVFKGDPNSGGVELQQAGANAGTDGWFFDYSSGILNFNGQNLPSGITATNIYIVGYRYIGATGARPPAGIGTFEHLYVAGVSTFMGSIDANSNLDVAGISTFQGLIDANGLIEATAGQNKIPSLYANYSDLPNAGTYHGMFAHVHQHAKGYFAHAGGWYELVNKETDGRVGTGTETYNVGYLDATNLDVTGITTLGNIGISTGRITGPAITYIDPATVGAAGTVVILGDLQVDGTQTTVNSSTMTVTDKNIELAKGAANDAAANTGGITVKSGDGDKTWQWLDATDSWTSSEHIRIPDDKVFGFASDTNTYIGRPAADTFAFTQNGNEKVRISSIGVGINTDVSLYNGANSHLVVRGNNITSSSDNAVAVLHSGTAGIGQLRFTDGATGYHASQSWIQYDHNATKFTIGWNAQGRIFGGPNTELGLYYDSPSNLDSNAHELVIGGGTGSGGMTLFNSTSGQGNIFFADGIGSAADKKRGQIIYDHTNNSMQFATNAVEKVRIDTDGNTNVVGILTAQYLMASGGSDANKQNVKIGWMQSENLSTGGYNVLVGRRAGEDVDTGGSLVLIGANAGQKLTNQGASVIIGGAAGSNLTGDGNVIIGRVAAQYSTSANSNVIIGTYAGIDSQGDENTLVGYYAGRGTSGNTDGTRNTFIGAKAGFKIRGGDDNTSLGRKSLAELLGGNKNVAIGQQAGDALVSGNNNIIIGYQADASTNSTSNEITLGDANITKFRIPGIGVTFSDDIVILPAPIDASGDLTVGGNFRVVGLSTFQDDVTINRDKELIFDRLGTLKTAIKYNDTLTLTQIRNANDPLEIGYRPAHLMWLTNRVLSTKLGGVNITGDTETDTLNVSGDSTFTGGATFNGSISAGSTTGTDGYYLKSTGIGVTWAVLPSSRTTSTQTATAGQTTFNFSYNIGFVDVFLNGVKLPSSEFTASNGSTIVLDDAAFANDTLEFISLNTVPVSSSGGAQNLTGLADVTISGTPVVGETLQHNGSEFVNDYTPTATLTSTTQVVILSLPIATYRSAEYTIQVTEGTKYHVTKILAIHDGTNVTFNEYGTLTTSTSLSTFALDVNSGNMRLLVTPASTNSTVFKVKFTAIKV